MTALDAKLRALGSAGVLGIGIGCFCAAFYFSALVPAERELASLQSLDRPARGQGPGRDAREVEIEAFRRNFPPAEHLTDELARVYRLAREAGLELLHGEYRSERATAGLVPYRISLPVRGTYAELRAFIGAILVQVPFASVDTLRFERRKSAEAQIEAQVRMTIYLRAGESGR